MPFLPIPSMPAVNKIFIIGGGDSLRGFDFSRLPKDDYKIGCNNSAFSTHCDALFSMDHEFIKREAQRIREFLGLRILSISPSNEPERIPEGEKVQDAIYVKRTRSEGLCLSPDETAGRNSGYGAINVATHMMRDTEGVCEIFLLGIDMRNGSHTHWHDGYRWDGPAADRIYRSWTAEFDVLKEALPNKFRIINVIGEPRSEVKCFETIELRDL